MLAVITAVAAEKHIVSTSQKLKKRGKKQKKKVSSVKLGRNKDEGNLSEEHHDQDDHNHTAFVYEDFDATDAITARQSAVTPRTLNFDDEAGPSSLIRPTQEEEPEEQFKDDEFLADIPLNIKKGKWDYWLKSPNKEEHSTLQQIRALETAHDEEVARKVQEEWDTEEERKRESHQRSPQGFYSQIGQKKKAKFTERRCKETPKGREKLTVTEEHNPSKKLKLRTEKIDSSETIIRNVDIEKRHR
ncbi:hypothetical protein Tco_1108395 [Tanacetum coccineum]